MLASSLGTLLAGARTLESLDRSVNRTGAEARAERSADPVAASSISTEPGHRRTKCW